MTMTSSCFSITSRTMRIYVLLSFLVTKVVASDPRCLQGNRRIPLSPKGETFSIYLSSSNQTLKKQFDRLHSHFQALAEIRQLGQPLFKNGMSSFYPWPCRRGEYEKERRYLNAVSNSYYLNGFGNKTVLCLSEIKKNEAWKEELTKSNFEKTIGSPEELYKSISKFHDMGFEWAKTSLRKTYDELKWKSVFNSNKFSFSPDTYRTCEIVKALAFNVNN